MLITPEIKNTAPVPAWQTPRQLLPLFYKQYHLSNDGGQGSYYVRIEFTKKIFIYFPNFDARRKAVFKHDIHHIATGYTSTFRGETEISAWEIASGCRHYWAAFLLDLHGMTIGILYNLPAVYKAFIKGRRTKNLYRDIFSDEQLLDIPLQEIRKQLLLDNYPSNTKGNITDFFLFLFILFAGALYSLLSLVILPFVLLFSLYVVIDKGIHR